MDFIYPVSYPWKHRKLKTNLIEFSQMQLDFYFMLV